MDQNALVFIGKLSPPLDCFGVAHVNVAVHKVVDHLDRIANLKLLKSAFLQVIGDGCNAIAHFNGISSYGKIRAVCAHNGDIGPVKCCNKWKLAGFLLGSQHLARQQRAYRMGNGIVYMKHVKVIDFSHLCHAGRQRQIVWRIFKQRILRDRNFMKQDVGMVVVQADRLLVGNEMDLMPTGGKFNAQFRTDYAAAAIGWITGDPDLHKSLPLGTW